MELLKEVAHISGKGGLYRIIKPTRAGVIVEAIDETKARAVVGANSRVSVLKEISIYTDTKEGSVGLGQVLTSIFGKFGAPVDLDPKTASEPELANFLGEVLPEYDRERVYTSDIKKLVTWFNILVRHLPEVFEEAELPTAEEEKVEAAVPEVKAEAADKQS